MSDPSLATQKAIFEALSSGLSPVKVYSAVPQGTSYPYVSMDSMVTMPDDPLAKRRDERILYLSVWSRYHGNKEVQQIMTSIYNLLHQVRLPMDTGRMVKCFVKSRVCRRESDNLTFQGAVVLRVITEH
jgi:hypothetical protein